MKWHDSPTLLLFGIKSCPCAVNALLELHAGRYFAYFQPSGKFGSGYVERGPLGIDSLPGGRSDLAL